MDPFVSIIIPVYNDAVALETCLKALAHQTYPTYEIIVVDNGSSHLDAITTLVEQCPKAVLSHEAKPGSYAARNRGISIAQGDIIGFTDADCIPDPEWIAQGVTLLLQYPDCGLVAGRIDLFFQDPSHLTAVELYDSVLAFPQQSFLKQEQFAATANIFTFKRVLDDVGSFDDRLKSSGDVEWGQRVYRAGYQQIYGDSVRVQHPARASWSQLYRRTIRHIGGRYDLECTRILPGLPREIVFVRMIAFNLMPPLFFLLKMVQDPQLPTLQQKLQVVGVLMGVRWVGVVELIRLRLGQISARQ